MPEVWPKASNIIRENLGNMNHVTFFARFLAPLYGQKSRSQKVHASIC